MGRDGRRGRTPSTTSFVVGACMEGLTYAPIFFLFSPANIDPLHYLWLRCLLWFSDCGVLLNLSSSYAFLYPPLPWRFIEPRYVSQFEFKVFSLCRLPVNVGLWSFFFRMYMDNQTVKNWIFACGDFDSLGLLLGFQLYSTLFRFLSYYVSIANKKIFFLNLDWMIRGS